jgi:hypothetical protein
MQMSAHGTPRERRAPARLLVYEADLELGVPGKSIHQNYEYSFV